MPGLNMTVPLLKCDCYQQQTYISNKAHKYIFKYLWAPPLVLLFVYYLPGANVALTSPQVNILLPKYGFLT